MCCLNKSSRSQAKPGEKQPNEMLGIGEKASPT